MAQMGRVRRAGARRDRKKVRYALAAFAAAGALAAGVAAAPRSAGEIVIERAADEGAAGAETAVAQPQAAESAPSLVVVHIDGCVSSPGVYELEDDPARVIDLVDAAGGLTEDADTSRINLAQPLVDGSKVHVPSADEAVAGDGGGGAAAASAESGLVNINLADKQQLMSLPGVGEATADAIIRDREANGPFLIPEDLMRVSGIGEKKFERLKDGIHV